MEKGKKTIDKNSIRFTIMAGVLIAIFCNISSNFAK